MKTTLTLITVLFALFKTSVCHAQYQVFREATVAHPQEVWNPVKLDDTGNNVINGLHFYAVDTDCNSKRVRLIKLVNTNPHPVELNYQLSAESPVVKVTVPASKTIEGSCNSADSNIQNLIIVIPEAKPEDEKKNKEYIRSHISVNAL